MFNRWRSWHNETKCERWHRERSLQRRGSVISVEKSTDTRSMRTHSLIQLYHGRFYLGFIWHCKCTKTIRPSRSRSTSRPQEDTMRSELVFAAKAYVSNAFLLTKLVSKATRKLHRPNTRIQDTTNDVFVRCGRANPIADGPCAGFWQPSFSHRASADPNYSAQFRRSAA